MTTFKAKTIYVKYMAKAFTKFAIQTLLKLKPKMLSVGDGHTDTVNYRNSFAF